MVCIGAIAGERKCERKCERCGVIRVVLFMFCVVKGVKFCCGFVEVDVVGDIKFCVARRVGGGAFDVGRERFVVGVERSLIEEFGFWDVLGVVNVIGE